MAMSNDLPPVRPNKRKRSESLTSVSKQPGDKEASEANRTRIEIACESCNRCKLKCNYPRPCNNCMRRGVVCTEQATKPRACTECKTRKIKCDQNQPCEKCTKYDRVCIYKHQEYMATSKTRGTTPSTVSSTALGPDSGSIPVPTDPFGDTFDFAQVWSVDGIMSQDTNDAVAFDLSAFEFDDFPFVTPFWPEPEFRTPPTIPLLSELNPAIAFDDFDRSRLIHDLAPLPNDCKGDLPPSSQLTRILHQYFEFVEPYTPTQHIPSFSVKSCPTNYLLLLLAIGDVYSKDQTVERWARKAFRYLVQREIELYENSSYHLPLTTIQGLQRWVAELSYSGDEKDVLYGSHCRLTLAHACRSLIAEQEGPDPTGDSAAAWITWIRRESIRRMLMAIYRGETAISTYLYQAPMVRVGELRVPLPDTDDLWYANSHQRWQQLRNTTRASESDPNPIRFDQVLSDLMNGEGDLVSRCSGFVRLHVVTIGIQELLLMARRLREVDGPVHQASNTLLSKARQALETWKTSWQSPQGSFSTTKAQYIATMSTWCWAELSLTAPEFLLRLGSRVATSTDLPSLMDAFLLEADQKLSAMESYTFNNLMTAAAAALYHVEVISEFHCFDDCVDTIRATVYPNVVASFFVGGLCLWYCARVLGQIGRYVPDTRNQIIPRLMSAVDAIRWQDESPLKENKSVTYLLGDLLMKTKVWGNMILF